MAGRSTRRTTKAATGAATPPATTGFGAAAPAAPAAGFGAAAPAPAAAPVGFGAAPVPQGPAAGGFGGFGGAAPAPQAATPMASAVAPAPQGGGSDPAVASALTEILAALGKLEKHIVGQSTTLKDVVSKLGEVIQVAGKLSVAPAQAATSAPTAPAPTAAAPPAPAAAIAAAPTQAGPADPGVLARAVDYVRQCASGFYQQNPGASLNVGNPEHLGLMAQVLSQSGVTEVAGNPLDPNYQNATRELLQNAGALDANGNLVA